MKKQGWEKILSDYIESHLNTPFRWGKSDCVLFACHGANKILEKNLSPIIKSYGAYNSRNAGEIIKESGGSICNIFDKHFKRHDNILMAKRGDIVVIMYEGQEAAGIIDLTGRNVACKGKKGVSFQPLKEVIAAWDIEEGID